MDKLIYLLKDHQVSIWCRRAAWIILTLNIIHTISFYSTLLPTNNMHSSSTQASDWFNLLEPLMSLVSGSLFNFLLLYAAAVAIEHLTGSTQK